MRWLLPLALIALLTPSVAHAYGEANANGAPNAEERLLHVFTNQIRQAPHAWPGWNTSLATAAPRRPLFIDTGLVVAARFHADDMAEHQTFAHESSDGTSFATRIARYFRGGAGENIFMTTGDERARGALTAWMNSAGHRTNMLDGDWNRLGTGDAIGASGRYAVQDFGQIQGGVTPPIPAGAAEKIDGDALRLIANFADARGRAPKSFHAVLDTAEIPLEHLAGPNGNETWAAEVRRPSGCASLIFVAVDADAIVTVFPETGALLAGTSCTDSFMATRAVGPDGTPTEDAGGGCTCTPARAPKLGLDRLEPAGGLASPVRAPRNGLAFLAVMLLFLAVRRRIA